MANETNSTPRKPRRWLRWIGYLLGGFIVLLVVAYFVGTSGWALKSFILPKVSTAMNAKVTVENASISPFSAVTLNGLKVETTGTEAEKRGSALSEPLVSAKEIRLRYSLMDIIKGNLNVSEVTLESPVINLVTSADGKSNLDPITGAAKEPKPAKAPQPKGESKAPQLNLGKFTLRNATIRKIDLHKDGTKQVVELTGVNITAENLGNSKTAKLALAAAVKFDQGLNTASNGVIALSINGSYDVTLDANLQPQATKGQTKVDVTEAKGAFAQAAAMGVVLNADLTPTQLNDVSVRIAQSGKNLGALTASGPFDATKMEGKLVAALTGIDRQVLGIAGAALGLDFNQTTISSTNTIELTQRGRMIAVNGAVLVGSFSVTQKGQTTPALDVRTSYAVTYDQTNRTALVQSFALNGTQNSAEFLRGSLARPMLLELGKASGAVDESAFDLIITNFNLAPWRAFAGTNVDLTSGQLAVNLQLVSQQAGKKLSLNLATQLRDLTAASGSNRIDHADIGLGARGTVQDFSVVNLESYRVELARGGQSAFSVDGKLQFNAKTQDAEVLANLETSLPQMAALVSVPGLDVSAGTVKFAGRVVQKNTTPQQTNNPVMDRSVTGLLNLDGFTGAFQSNRFDRFVTALNIDLAMRGDAVDIKKCSGTLQQSGLAGGAFDVAGNYNLASKAGQVTAKLVDLNQNTLKSFLASALGDKKLESVTINSTTTAKLDGATDMALKTELHVANLVVNDPSGQVPRTPLGLDLNADVAMVKQVAELRNVTLALAKTERAPNSLTVAGRIDMAKSNAWTGNLKITSDGLDVTPYYDLFAGNKPKETTDKGPATAPQPIPREAKPESEPPAMTLPFAQFVADLSIAKLFLREVAISNWVTKAAIDSGKVNVNPFSLTLNGAPVSLTALANVGVPGYQYDVNAKIDRVPVEPIVNTFAPEKRGRMKGDLIASAQVSGAGLTGASLQKNLGGSILFSLTNANVQVTTSPKWQALLKPLAAVLRVPELANSPLNWIDARLGIGSGTITLTNTTVESSLFRGGTAGTMTLAQVLTNSTFNNLPVSIELRRSVAGWAKNLPGTTRSADFVALPHFYTVGGTLGKPNPHIDTAAVAKLVLGEALQSVGGDAGKILRGVTGLGGATTTSTNAPATNAPANLLRGLGDLLQKPPKTNAPAKRGGGFLKDVLK